MSEQPVRVHAMTLGLASDEEPTEWFACCTDADWSRGGVSCNWYGAYRGSKAEANSDAARHRRSHKALAAALAEGGGERG